jgi:hypothetical protein
LAEIIDEAVRRRLDMKAWEEDGEREKKAIRLLKKAVHSIDTEFQGPAKMQVISDEIVKTEPPTLPEAPEEDDSDAAVE